MVTAGPTSPISVSDGQVLYSHVMSVIFLSVCAMSYTSEVESFSREHLQSHRADTWHLQDTVAIPLLDQIYCLQK